MIWKLLLQLLTFWMSVKVTPKKIIQYIETHAQSDKNNIEYVAPETVRVSCVQLKIQPQQTLESYLDQLISLTRSAVDAGSQMVVFPELTGLLAGMIIPGGQRILRWMTKDTISKNPAELSFDPERLHIVAEALHGFFYETYLETFGALARALHIYIVAGSCLFYEQGKLYNRAVVFGPDGQPIGYQDKTTCRGIDQLLGICPGEQIHVIPTALGDLSVCIGCDNRYFETMHIAKAQGAKLFAVPSLDFSVSPEILRCRANQFQTYIVCAQFITGKNDQPATGIYCPDALAKNEEGTLVRSITDGTGVLTTRINLAKLGLISSYPSINTAFMHGDYLESYQILQNGDRELP